MNDFEKRYCIKENQEVKRFHKSRRMFCIYQNKLIIAGPSLAYSHAIWFEKEGWISRENDELMNEIVRGYVDSTGDIYFYTGYDFMIDNKTEQIFFLHLKELVEKLNLNPSALVIGGLIKDKGKIMPSAAKCLCTNSSLS